MNYIVKSANWCTIISIDDDIVDTEWEFVEAATRAIEHIYATNNHSTLDGNEIQISSNILVIKKENTLSENASIDEILDLIDNNKIKYIFSPIALANAGKYEMSNLLLQLIENSSENI